MDDPRTSVIHSPCGGGRPDDTQGTILPDPPPLGEIEPSDGGLRSYFELPAANEPCNWRWKTMYAISTGTTVITTPANMAP